MDISLAKELISCISGIDFEIIENNEELLYNNFVEKSRNLVKQIYKDKKSIKQFINFSENVVYEFKWILNSSYILFYVKSTNKIYALGPLYYEPFKEYRVLKQLEQMNLSKETIKELLFYGALLPVVKQNTVEKLSIILYKKISKTKKSITHEVVNIFNDKKISVNDELNVDKQTTIREVEQRYELGTALTEAVKEGNFSLAIDFLSRNYTKSALSKRNNSPLRNMQNYCIIINTQLRHALEDVIHPFTLDKISDENGKNIEKLSSIKDAENLMVEIIREYCKLAKDNKYKNLKPLIYLTVAYVKENLNKEITVKQTAQELGVNANYLSCLFNKEMGLSFIEFLNTERIKQAEKLLKYTNMQVQQIALFIGYSNTAYFIRTFYKYLGISPKNYRKSLVKF